jgi:uncharacterized membrane protein YeaQ/YmgE (transglycosylase-associated protein family)
MVLGAFTMTFSDLALQIIVGAIAAGATGHALRGGSFGLLGDLVIVIGVLGALAANFVVGYFALFNLAQFGLMGELIVAIIGASLFVVLVRLATSRRSARADA